MGVRKMSLRMGKTARKMKRLSDMRTIVKTWMTNYGRTMDRLMRWTMRRTTSRKS
jgi:hypothetical protein